MSKNRLEAFSDGVLAIIITIMVLELKRPEQSSFTALRPMLPLFLSYVLSFLYVGIYWNNHHHLIHAATRVNGSILWANLHLLFWISLFPFATAWLGEHSVATAPAAAYGIVLFMAAIAYLILQRAIIRHQGPESRLAAAVGSDWKGKLSVFVYLAAILVSLRSPWMSIAMYTFVAALWLTPDKRIERRIASNGA